MTTAIAHKPRTLQKEKTNKKAISLEAFLSHYSNKEDGYKYEWHNGHVEKTPRTMNRDQSQIQAAILAYFYTNPKFRQEGAFLVELDMFRFPCFTDLSNECSRYFEPQKVIFCA